MRYKAKPRMSKAKREEKLKEGLSYVAYPNTPEMAREYIEMYYMNVVEGNAEILSFGAGIQSTALLIHGILKNVTGLGAAIFSDTGWEREQTYENVKFMVEYAYQHQIPVFIVKNGDIRADTLNPEKRAPSMPFFINTEKVATIEYQRQQLLNSILNVYPSPQTHEEAETEEWQKRLKHWERNRDVELSVFDQRVKKGEITEYTTEREVAMLRRQCTNEYKILPITKLVRGLTGCSMHYPATQWIGISIDEIQRMKQPRPKYLKFRYPLVENRISRSDCVDFMEQNGFTVPVRSSCVGCPFHDNTEWLALNDEEFKDACDFDESVRAIGMTHPSLTFEYTKDSVYLRRDLKPLAERNFEKGETLQLPLFETKDTTCDEGGCFL